MPHHTFFVPFYIFFIDPHMISWHSIPFDFQYGCDVVLVDNAFLKFHLRLVKHLMTPLTPFSYIEAVGIKFANDDVFEARIDNYITSAMMVLL